jgi:hypothetical protein
VREKKRNLRYNDFGEKTPGGRENEVSPIEGRECVFRITISRTYKSKYFNLIIIFLKRFRFYGTNDARNSSHSFSCRINPEFGLIQGRFDFTKAKLSSKDHFFDFINHAIVMVALRDSCMTMNQHCLFFQESIIDELASIHEQIG